MKPETVGLQRCQSVPEEKRKQRNQSEEIPEEHDLERVHVRADMFVWARFPQQWQDQMSTMDFAMKLLEQGNVAVSPGTGFGTTGEGFLRMALVENENRLRQGIRQIKACLK